MLTGSEDSSVSAVISLQGWTTWKSWLEVSGRWTFFSSSKRPDGVQVPPGVFPPRGMKPTIRLNLVTSWRIRGAVPLFPPFAFMVWTGTNSAGGNSVELYWEGCGMKGTDRIFENNQLDAQFFFMCVYSKPLHVSGSHVPIIRRINCINTSGICHSENKWII